MATSRTATGKKTAAKTTSSTPTKKPSAKKAVAVKPATRSKTPAKKTATAPAKKTTAKAAAPAKSAPRKAAKKTTVLPEERYQMIATAAYFLAERRGFSGCYEMEDWITAEVEIDAKLNA